MPTSYPNPPVQIRVSVAFGTQPRAEPTSTLVLTGRTGFYIDMRIFEGGEMDGKVDWVSSGQRITHPPVEAGQSSRVEFKERLEHRPLPWFPDPHSAPLADVGSFTTLTNGDFRETGESWNPEQGKIENYEEIWRDVELGGAKEDLSVVILESSDGAAWYVKVGKWEQAMERKGGDWWFGRWEDGEEKNLIGGAAARDGLVRVADGWMAEEGKEVVIGGRGWIVRESS